MSRVEGMKFGDTTGLRSYTDRPTRLAALRHLTGTDGRDLDVAVALGLVTEDHAALLRRVLSPAATAPDPAGCAACGRRSGRGCAVCRGAVAG